MTQGRSAASRSVKEIEPPVDGLAERGVSFEHYEGSELETAERSR